MLRNRLFQMQKHGASDNVFRNRGADEDTGATQCRDTSRQDCRGQEKVGR